MGRWYLGDWVSDVDLFRASDAVSVSTPEGFVYTAQHFVGLAAASIFYGVEGKSSVVAISCAKQLWAQS